MNVWVVMGNDYPDSVFDNVENAERYVDRLKNEPGNKHTHGGGYRIYWRVSEFELRREAKK
jgi:hypothetical protein